jgi:hypothetical protein
LYNYNHKRLVKAAGKVIQKVSSKRKAEDDKNNKRKAVLFLLLLLLVFFIIIFFACKCMGISAPTISASTDAWSKKVLVSVDEDAKANKKIVYYEYCLSRSKDTRDCNWQRTDTKNAEVSMSGTWYVFFRGVTEDGRTGDPSTPVIVKIDNAGPVVNKVNKPKLTGDSITVSVDATDEDSGITKYLFSLDGKNFVEGDKTYTFEGLSPKQKYTV